jgi:hypothetical protein
MWSEAISKASAVKVRNVMNPLLWLNAVVEPLFLLGAWLFKDHVWLALPFIMGFLGLPAFTLWEFRHFARRDPQRLQSEQYLLAHQRLMIHSKSVQEPIDAGAIPAGTNPEHGGFQGEATMPVSSDTPAARRPSQGTQDE